MYQSISLINFDLVLETILLKEFKSILKEYINIYLDANYLTNYLTITGIDNITSFDITPAYFAIDNNTPLYLAIYTIIKKAKMKCEKNFTISLKTFFSFVNFDFISLVANPFFSSVLISAYSSLFDMFSIWDFTSHIS